MGCVTSKKQTIIYKLRPGLSQNSQSFDEDDQPNYRSAPQSPALKKIVQIGALTPDEIKDFVVERRSQNNRAKRLELMKKSGRYTPTIIYKYRQQTSSYKSPSKDTNISPVYPTQK